MAKCEDCGLDYEEFGVDITFSHDEWGVISEGGNSLLCGTCIARRVAKIRGTVAIRARIDYVRQVCGHPVSAIVSSDEGTHYCALCTGNLDKSVL